MHSQNRQLDSLRRLAPEPLVEMHTALAAELGLAEGDYAWVETQRGRLCFKAHIHDRIREDTVAVHHAWWLPETPGPLHSVLETCANILTDDDPDLCDPVFGSSPLKALLCKVYKRE